MSLSFGGMTAQLDSLRAQLAVVEAQADTLRRQIQEAESLITQSEQIAADGDSKPNTSITSAQTLQQDQKTHVTMFGQQANRWPLSQEEYKRYGRQMIMSEVGLQGQLRLKRARVLVIGVGGLGCPAATYLAGAGVGTLGLVDGDTVEESNLHRQIAHTTSRVGWNKAESAKEHLKALNPLVSYQTHPSALSPTNALPIISDYDLVLDCTDHPTSRYLISDACVLAGKPLVSASALRTDGQLIVLNDPPKPPGDPSGGGPCYRCIFPRPPPADSVLSCGEGGILGPVVGIMGVLQALEAIKLITTAGRSEKVEPPRASMLIFSANSSPPFRQVRMRSRRGGCAVCSSLGTVTRENLLGGSMDYVAFCGGGRDEDEDVLGDEFRTGAGEFAELISSEEENVLVDVRDATQFGMCALPGSRNVPWTGDAESWVKLAREAGAVPEEGKDCYVVCRFGNDSQLAVKALRDSLRGSNDDSGGLIKDVRGGFHAWRRDVDAGWPDY